MADQFSHIEEAFKNAFEHWDAPHTPAEMNSGWEQVSHQLPNVPATHAPSAGHAVQHVASGVSKLIGLGGLGAAVVTSAIVLYNIYVKPASTKVSPNKPATETTVANKQTENSGVPGKINTQNSIDHSSKAKNHSYTYTGSSTSDRNNSTLPNNNSSIYLPPSNQVQSGNGYNSGNNQPSKVNGSSNSKPAVKMQLSESGKVFCVNEPASVNYSSNLPELTLNWGDGNTAPVNPSSGQNVHRYTRPGKFILNLSGDNYFMQDTLTVIDKPRARFTVQLSSDLKCIFNNVSRQGETY